MSATSSKPDLQDAISILTHDHKEVKTAFKEFEALGDRAFVHKKNLADNICKALTIHATVEEEIFYPAVRKAAKEGNDMVDEAVVEHASAKELIAQILSMGSEDDLFDAKVKVLSEQIDHHATEEEEQMFVRARNANIDLVELGQQIAVRKEQLLMASEAVWPLGAKIATDILNKFA